MNISRKMKRAIEACGVKVADTKAGVTITYLSSFGCEEVIELEADKCSDGNVAIWLADQWRTFNVSREAMAFMDEDGRGVFGSPCEMEGVIDEKKEWKRRLFLVSTAASNAIC